MYGVKMFYGPILSGAATGASTGSFLGPVGAAAGAVIGAGVSAFSQAKMNKKMRRWNEKMYALQREHSLADWAMQNAYNSPEAQMERLKAAGLNPNLVYGHGAEANSGSMPRSASSGSWSPQTPDVGGIVTAGVFAGLDRQIKEQQLENLKAQKGVMDTQVLEKTANIANTNVKTETGKFGLDLNKQLRDTVVNTAQENLRNIGIRSDTMLAANERAVLANAQSLREGAERILSMRLSRAKTGVEMSQMRANIENLKRSGALQELEIQQRRLGINPNSSTAVQMVGRLLNSDILDKLESKTERGLKYHKDWIRPFTKEWFNR